MIWSVIYVTAVLLLWLHWHGSNAVWGAAIIGFVIGLIWAGIPDVFDWSIVAKVVSIAVLQGAVTEWIFIVSNKRQSAPVFAEATLSAHVNKAEPLSALDNRSERFVRERYMTEKEAIDIVSDFGEAFATCNDEWQLFKSQSSLPREPQSVVHAMKVSYQQGYPFSEQMDNAYGRCYPQISFFIPDDQFERASSYFGRHYSTDFAVLYRMAQASLNPVTTIITDEDWVFGRNLLDGVPDDPDKEWVRELAQKCWRDFRARVAEWREFVALVKAGESGLESLEVALLQMEANKIRRELEEKIELLRPNGKAVSTEKTRFYVVLEDFGKRKIGVIKAVRDATGLGIKEAKDLVEGAPNKVKDGLCREDAEKLKEELEEAGASVSVMHLKRAG